MTLTLYHTPQSTCSQKVRLALNYKKLDWQQELVVLSKNEHLTPEYLQINPNGVVPALVHNGTSIPDSSVINEYLEDVFPERPLRPADPLLCAKMRVWRQYIDEVPTTAIRIPSFNKYFMPNWASMSEEEFEAHVERLPLRKGHFRRMGRTGFSESEVEGAMEQLAQTLNRMSASFENGPWLVGENYTLADVSITPTVVRLEDLGLSHMWDKLPKVSNWYERILALGNFAPAYAQNARVLSPKV